jgi:type II secretory pathway pseudopilin PulG
MSLKLIPKQTVLKNSGFSLTQLLVSLGITSVVALLVMTQLSSSQKINIKSEFVQDVSLASNLIQKELSSRPSCTLTMKPQNINSQNPSILRGIPNPEGRMHDPLPHPQVPTLFRKGGRTNRSLEGDQTKTVSSVLIEDIQLINEGINTILRVTFTSDSRLSLLGSNKINKDFIINFDPETSTCFTERDDQAKMIKHEACIAVGGNFINDQCKLDNLPDCILVTNASQCPSNTYQFIDEILLGADNSGTTSVQSVSRCCQTPQVARPPIPIPPNPRERSCDMDPSRLECQTCPVQGANGCITCNHTELPTWSPPICGQCSTGSSPTKTCIRTCLNGYSEQDCNQWCGSVTTSWTESCSTTGEPEPDSEPGPDPIHGGWSDWIAGLCSKGEMIFTRTCTNPAPANGGNQCIGSTSKRETCTICVPKPDCIEIQQTFCQGQSAGKDECGNDCGWGAKICDGSGGCGPYNGGSVIWQSGNVVCCKPGMQNDGDGCCSETGEDGIRKICL